MPYYRSVGEVPHKRHTQFRRPDGGLYAEELMGQEGFSSDSSLLYHRHAPTAIVSATLYEPSPDKQTPNLPLTPRHLRTLECQLGRLVRLSQLDHHESQCRRGIFGIGDHRGGGFDLRAGQRIEWISG